MTATWRFRMAPSYSLLFYNLQHAFHQPKTRFYFLWALHLIQSTYPVFVLVYSVIILLFNIPITSITVSLDVSTLYYIPNTYTCGTPMYIILYTSCSQMMGCIL